MSILASLARAYDRLPDAPPFGYSTEKIGFLVALNEDGTVAHVADLRSSNGKKKQARSLNVPTSFKRSGTTPRPFFLWDNANYALGASIDIDPDDRRFEAFRVRHLKFLQNETDVGLSAFRAFLERWSPADVDKLAPRDELRVEKIAFALESERRETLLHERHRARQLWGEISADWRAVEGKEPSERICLVTGLVGPIARTHPAIRGIPSKGGKDADSIVSFNEKAFESYGHEQGDNAPVSEAAAFAYTTALNRFLERDSGHRLQIGDASTVFWADATDAEAALLAEALFPQLFDPAAVEADTAKDVGILLERLRKGEQALGEGLALKSGALARKVEKGVRFYVLGLAPNAARISIRFYHESDFGELLRNYRDYVADLRFEPRPKDRRISISGLVLRTAPARKDRNGRIKFDSAQISPLVSGELFRAILTGDRFPRALLAQILMRVRSDHLLDSLRISMIKAVIIRDMRKQGRLPKEDYLVRSDPDDPNPARRLGKLFALIERAQLAALGDRINTSVKDKYLSSCATTPAQIFSKLILNAEEHHLKRLRNGHSDADWIKDADHARRVGAAIGRDIGQLAATFENSFPKQHSDEEQGFFLIGYYQERFGSRKAEDDGGDPIDDEQTTEGEE